MFCSNCGKTIHPTDQFCPHCNAAIGDNRFGGTPYTSAQFTIQPGQTTFEAQEYEPANDYTRTTYTGGTEPPQDNGGVDSRTSYRPVYDNDTSISREMRLEMRKGPRIGDVVEDDDSVANFIPGVPLSQAAKETLNELDEQLRPEEQIDRSQFKSRPIETSGRAGISKDVSEYIRNLENSQNRKAARRSQEVYDDYAPQDDAAEDDSYAPQNDNYEDEGLYDDEGYDSEEYEDARRMPLSVSQIAKIAIALVVVAALVFGIITWVRYVGGNQSSAPIEGVTESFYTQGIELIKSHTESEYIDGLIAQYTSDGILSMSNSLTAATNALDALMPENPATNDGTFLQALKTIENNIGSAVTMDALAVGSDDPNAAADSQGRWQIVNNAIAQLEAATSAAQLTSIINGQTITVQNNTPEPTQAPEIYNTLSRGDENNDVLRLQVRLYDLGYLTGDRDGVFGSQTATAVGMFQQTAGLEATGYADNATQVLLYSDDAPYAPGATTPTPATTETPTPEPTEEPIQPAEADGGTVEGELV